MPTVTVRSRPGPDGGPDTDAASDVGTGEATVVPTGGAATTVAPPAVSPAGIDPATGGPAPTGPAVGDPAATPAAGGPAATGPAVASPAATVSAEPWPTARVTGGGGGDAQPRGHPLAGRPQPLRPGDRRDVREQLPQGGVVRQRVWDVTGARWRVFPVDRPPEQLLQLVEHLEQTGPRPEGEVDRMRVVHPAAERVEDDLADRADVGEVAGLGAVAVHHHRLAAQGGVGEPGDDGRVRVVVPLPGTVDVEEPEGQCGQPERRLVRQGVRLGGELAGRVGAHRTGPGQLRLGQRRVHAVHRRGGGDEHVPDVVPAGRLQHHQRAGGVRVVGGQRIAQRAGHAGQGGQVDHRLPARHRRVQGGRVQDRPLDEIDVQPVEVAAQPDREVVQDADLLDGRLAQGGAGQVGADETGPPVIRMRMNNPRIRTSPVHRAGVQHITAETGTSSH